MTVSLLKISPALQILIDSGIVDIDSDHGRDEDWGTGEYTFHLRGPWDGSDYAGDEYTESNQRSLYRDYPQFLISTGSYVHSAYGLDISPDFGLDSESAEMAEYLANELAGLVNNGGAYDEQDVYDLVNERAQASWDSYLRSDIQRDICKMTGADICLDDMEDTFWELLRDHDIYPEHEGHRDVIFRGIGDEPFLVDLARKAVEFGAIDMDYSYT
jgi:hypothetical protein